MTTNRRDFLRAGGAALLLFGGIPSASWAAPNAALRLIEPLGRPSVVWTALGTLQPALGQILGCAVELQTVTGDDGLNALHAAADATAAETRIFGGPVMATQYAETIRPYDVKLEGLTPIAKLTEGFSVAIFVKAGGAIGDWPSLAKRASSSPVAVSSLERATAAYIADLMIERKARLPMATTLRPTIAAVVDDVLQGRADAGIIPTVLVARQPGDLLPLATFGARRNARLAHIPTFAELMGDPKLAFTESVGAFGPAGLSKEARARLESAFLAAGQDEGVMSASEGTDFPVAVKDADTLVATMARNRRVLDTILT